MRDSWSGLLSGARQAADAATPAFAFQTVTASPPARGVREADSLSAAAYCVNAIAMNNVNSPGKVTTLVDRLVVWVFMVPSSIFLSICQRAISVGCRRAHSSAERAERVIHVVCKPRRWPLRLTAA